MDEVTKGLRREWLARDHRAEEGPLLKQEPSRLDQLHLNCNAYFGKGPKRIAHILSYWGEILLKGELQSSNPCIFSFA